MYFDRRASPELVDDLRPGGVLHPLIDIRNEDPALRDVQLRRVGTSPTSWVSLYVGLTTVLDVVRGPAYYRLRAHATHKQKGGFDDAWRKPQTVDQLQDRWTAVEEYIHRVIPAVGPRHTLKEGALHAAMCSCHSPDYRVLDREACVGFDDQDEKSRVISSLKQELDSAMDATGNAEKWWVLTRDAALGTGLDLLGVDPAGRVLVIEVKPGSSPLGIARGPRQVAFYVRLFQRWADASKDGEQILNKMLRQRVTLGLTDDGPELTHPLVFVPVLAIGEGSMSREIERRLRQLAGAMNASTLRHERIAPFEVWRVDASGHRVAIEVV